MKRVGRGDHDRPDDETENEEDDNGGGKRPVAADLREQARIEWPAGKRDDQRGKDVGNGVRDRLEHR